jgi:hypothetical protein
MVFATLLYDDAAGAEKEDVLSWSLATSDTVLQKTVRYLLAQSGVELDSDDGPVFVVDALVEQPTKRDAVLLSPGLADGSRVRVYTAEQRAALPNSIVVAALHPHLPDLAPTRTSFLASHINTLARADSSLVPRLQVTVHLLTLHDVDPRTECFTAVLNLMIDWVDEQLAGKEKDEIDEIVGNPDLYVRPAVSIGNMVGGDEALAGATPRCDNSKTGNIKLTAKITGTFASPMDMHRFPFDTQTLHFETIVRSITLDKKHLINDEQKRATALGLSRVPMKGHESHIIKKTNNARLLIEVVDAAHQNPVRAGRKHQIKEDADKVHEWSFSTSRVAMDGLATAEWRALKQQYAERQQEQARARTDAAHRSALAGCIAVLKRLAKAAPTPQMQHSPLLSEESKHVVLFEIAREVGATMWTLTLPVFLVTFISFSQFYVPENALADRLSVSLTTILTIIAFQVVVRDKVSAPSSARALRALLPPAPSHPSRCSALLRAAGARRALPHDDGRLHAGGAGRHDAPGDRQRDREVDDRRGRGGGRGHAQGERHGGGRSSGQCDGPAPRACGALAGAFLGRRRRLPLALLGVVARLSARDGAAHLRLARRARVVRQGRAGGA